MIPTDSARALMHGSLEFLDYLVQHQDEINSLFSVGNNQDSFWLQLRELCKEKHKSSFSFNVRLVNLLLYYFAREPISDIDKMVIETQYGFDLLSMLRQCNNPNESQDYTNKVLCWPYQENSLKVLDETNPRFLTPGFSSRPYDSNEQILTDLYGAQVTVISLTKSRAHGSAGFGSSLRNILHDIDHWNEIEAVLFSLLRGRTEGEICEWFNNVHYELQALVHECPALSPYLYICFRDNMLRYLRNYTGSPFDFKHIILHGLVEIASRSDREPDLISALNRFSFNGVSYCSSPVDGHIYNLNDGKRVAQDDIKHIFGTNSREIFGDKANTLSFGVYDPTCFERKYNSNFSRRRRLFEWYQVVQYHWQITQQEPLLPPPTKETIDTDEKLAQYVKTLNNLVYQYLIMSLSIVMQRCKNSELPVEDEEQNLDYEDSYAFARQHTMDRGLGIVRRWSMQSPCPDAQQFSIFSGSRSPVNDVNTEHCMNSARAK